uniref:Uncharacterized protein n=1 Tax=Anguilla anguilla TaxID=7936 RepID=A0A0E9XD35_ANGAN
MQSYFFPFPFCNLYRSSQEIQKFPNGNTNRTLKVCLKYISYTGLVFAIFFLRSPSQMSTFSFFCQVFFFVMIFLKAAWRSRERTARRKDF